MIRQTVALFIDAYRELNARKLFWITLILSVIVVVAFALLGINDRGISFLHWNDRGAGQHQRHPGRQVLQVPLRGVSRSRSGSHGSRRSLL